MKLEFLNDITDGGKYPQADPNKLVRLFDFDQLELAKIKHLISRSFVEGHGELIISNLDFVQALNCTLTFQISDQDLGIKYSPDNNNFLGKFSRNRYINMIDILDRLGEGYNWLYDPSDEDQIDLLISSGGSW